MREEKRQEGREKREKAQGGQDKRGRGPRRAKRTVRPTPSEARDGEGERGAGVGSVGMA